MACVKHNDLPFLSQQKKINKVHKFVTTTDDKEKKHVTTINDEVHKLVTTLDDKEKYVVHRSALKQALDHGLKLKKVFRVIEFKQEAWSKPYIHINPDLRKDAKNDFEKDHGERKKSQRH